MVETETKVNVESWGIEIDHPRNCDCLIQSIPGCILRSAVIASKPVKDRKTGRMLIPPDQAAYLGQFPPIPGMQLHVNPAKLTYTIIDPLADNEELCESIRQAMDSLGPFRAKGKLKGVETQRGRLDVHRMKTLVREMSWLVKANEAKVIKGALPEDESIEKMPGNFLLNPGSRVSNTQPLYEKDFPAWLERLTAAGG